MNQNPCTRHFGELNERFKELFALLAKITEYTDAGDLTVAIIEIDHLIVSITDLKCRLTTIAKEQGEKIGQ